MPVKFTDNVCREEKIFKHTMGRLKEIVLPATIAEQVRQGMPSASTRANPPQARNPAPGHEERNDAEVVLPDLPDGLVVEVTEGHSEPHLYFLKPETVVWYRDKLKQAPVRRRGFQLVPDFAGTAHAYCGDTLHKCKGELLE